MLKKQEIRDKQAKLLLESIIERCKRISSGKEDPFKVEILEILDLLDKFLPLWEDCQQLSADAEALHYLSEVMVLQYNRLYKMAQRLHASSLLLRKRLEHLDPQKLAKTFLQCWHPIVFLQQMTLSSLMEGLTYWINLYGWGKIPPMPTGEMATRISGQGLFDSRSFLDELKSIELELAERLKSGPIKYSHFIKGENFKETVRRAYLLSHLVSLGLAKLEFDEKAEDWLILPHRSVKGEDMVSIVIDVSEVLEVE